MKKALMFLYGTLAGFYWLIGLTIFLFIAMVTLLISQALGTLGSHPPLWLIWPGIILLGILPAAIKIFGRIFIVRRDSSYNRIVLAINRINKVVDFGNKFWKKKGYTYECIDEYTHNDLCIIIERRAEDFIVNLTVRLLINSKIVNGDVDYYSDLRKALTKGSFEDQFAELVRARFAKVEKDVLSLILNSADDNKSIRGKIIEKLAITNAYHKLIDVEISIAGISIKRMLPPED